MARELRLEYPGAIYHVTARGNGRQSLFRDAKGRHYLYKRLAESVPLYGVRLYASHVQAHRRREDASFRTVGCKRVEPGLVLAAVAKAAGVEVEGLRARRRDWPWKGIAAQMLIRHSRLTQRDCAERLGLGTGAAVSYQVRQAEQAVAADGKLRITIARLSEGLRHGAR